MMSFGKYSLSMLVLATATLTIGVSACSGGGGDDDDDGNTPLPNPYSYCEAIWQSESSTPDLFDSVYLFGPLANWSSGVQNLGAAQTDSVATFTWREDFVGGTFDTSVYTTSGTYTVTAPSTSLGEPADITAFDVTTWVLSEGSNLNATAAGNGSLEGGQYNDVDDCIPTPDPNDCILSASGDVPVTVAGSSINVGFSGGGVGLLLCYDPQGAFAPTAEHQKNVRRMANEILKSRR